MRPSLGVGFILRDAYDSVQDILSGDKDTDEGDMGNAAGEGENNDTEVVDRPQ